MKKLAVLLLLSPLFVKAQNADSIKYAGSVKYYTKIIADKPGDAEAYYKRGSAKSKLKSYQEAIKDFDKAISINPKYEDAFIGRGRAKDDLEDYKGAIGDYSAAILIKPSAIAYYERAVTKAHMDDHKAAILDFDKSIALDPNDEDAYNERGVEKKVLEDCKGDRYKPYRAKPLL
jgi:tetratricopeptide (TPR) repeat protein